MKFRIWDTCECGCGDRVFFIFESKPFQFRWFMDSGYWFIYIHFGRKYFRFSSAGYLSGITKLKDGKDGS